MKILKKYTQFKVVKYNNKEIFLIEIQSEPKNPYYLANKRLKPSRVYLKHSP